MRTLAHLINFIIVVDNNLLNVAILSDFPVYLLFDFSLLSLLRRGSLRHETTEL